MYAVHVQYDWTKPTTQPVTKWDALTAKRDALKAALELAEHQLEGLANTPCGLKCSGCGKELPTEAAFAQHFTIKRQDLIADRLNLGDCPLTGNKARPTGLHEAVLAAVTDVPQTTPEIHAKRCELMGLPPSTSGTGATGAALEHLYSKGQIAKNWASGEVGVGTKRWHR